MSPQNVEVVRQTLRVHERSSRTLDQRLGIRFPRLAGAAARLLGRLPPSSRLRQAALLRSLRLAAEAYNRLDLEAVVVTWHADCEYHPARNL
ncbi:MAG TPA: hypothetical protein VEQ41_09115, partial [Solirubrobacterales bacterium]|nr:hypothetical protein [Solirubrobacterales bacterium]